MPTDSLGPINFFVFLLCTKEACFPAWLAIMIPTLRVLSLFIGAALVAAPSFLLLQFAYGVGEPPTKGDVAFFLPTIGIGLFLGGGLLLVGLPKLVSGATTPALSVISGVLIALSALVVAFFGFSGSVTRMVSPFVLFLELFVFWVFVYPANFFPRTSRGDDG